MQWFLLVLISLISSRVHVYGAAVPEKKLQHAAEVVGSVFCDTCLQHQFSKTSHFISGASVLVECTNGISSKAKTDGSGRFRARLPFSVGENENEVRNCTVQLMSSSEPKCSVSSIGRSSSLQLKSSSEGIHIYAAGFLVFKPLKLPRICRKLKDKEIKIPIPSNSGDQASTNPKHKKLSESSSTSFSRPGSDQERTTSNFPEFIFPPFPFQPPPLFPPIPGFNPPPLIPLPPIPGFTPPPLIPLPPIPGFTPPSPPPLIPLPPIPGFTPPSPPPFIPLPPIPFPGLTPPPPPPLFPLPPIPGFTPPSPPPTPFIPIPLPPIPFPGFNPPPPPPPPPPAFPFPLPPFPPLPFPPLPPFPGRPPASPSPDKSRTNP